MKKSQPEGDVRVNSESVVIVIGCNQGARSRYKWKEEPLASGNKRTNGRNQYFVCSGQWDPRRGVACYQSRFCFFIDFSESLRAESPSHYIEHCLNRYWDDGMMGRLDYRVGFRRDWKTKPRKRDKIKSFHLETQGSQTLSLPSHTKQYLILTLDLHSLWL